MRCWVRTHTVVSAACQEVAMDVWIVIVVLLEITQPWVGWARFER